MWSVTVRAIFFVDYSQLSAEDLDRVPANSTSNILNRLLVTYDSRIRPNFKGTVIHQHNTCFVFRLEQQAYNLLILHRGHKV